MTGQVKVGDMERTCRCIVWIYLIICRVGEMCIDLTTCATTIYNTSHISPAVLWLFVPRLRNSFFEGVD
jgi:hypothetical protein